MNCSVCLCVCVCVCVCVRVCVRAAPSPVSVVRKGLTGKSSIALSWAEPDRPNGIILEYEIKYFEKVKKILNCSFFFFFAPYTKLCVSVYWPWAARGS